MRPRRSAALRGRSRRQDAAAQQRFTHGFEQGNPSWDADLFHTRFEAPYAALSPFFSPLPGPGAQVDVARRRLPQAFGHAQLVAALPLARPATLALMRLGCSIAISVLWPRVDRPFCPVDVPEVPRLARAISSPHLAQRAMPAERAHPRRGGQQKRANARAASPAEHSAPLFARALRLWRRISMSVSKVALALQ